jgi:uroporphyrin-III C-methyltransferase
VIVGAGPGAADLLTLRAARALERAQVVLFDDLVSPEILALCPAGARLINVGKRCGQRGSTQEQINALMVWHARRGRMVVRLKSGDPAVFGRLGEELDALRQAGIAFEVVPGITAAAAAASAAGLTLTDRRSASALVVLTAHNAPGNDKAARTNPLDPEHTTYAVYMPGPDYARTARDLMQMGVDSATPCAVVSHAGRSSEKVHFLVLADLGSRAAEIASPAVLIVGKVANQRKAAESRVVASELFAAETLGRGDTENVIVE